VELVDVLLSLGADINATDVDGATPLYSAAVKGYSEVALKLIAVNADVTIPSAGNDDKDITALHCVAENGNIMLAKALLQKGANVNAITARNASPIFYAVRNNHVNMVQLLLEHGADCNGTGQDGWNSLLIASFIGSEECLELLLDADASVTALDGMKRNAIHLAAEKEHMGCIRVLKGKILSLYSDTVLSFSGFTSN
jgi:ankyrin repeat protein